MRIAVVGGGPAGLYFSALVKKARPDADVVVFERNPAGATYGWGVVFSDRTLTSFREADYKTYQRIVDDFIIWDAIDVRYRDEVVRCEGQGFSGIARMTLLRILQERGLELGVDLRFERELSDIGELESYDLVVAADGVRSLVRDTYGDAFRPRFSEGRSRYIWFGTTRAFDSFTFAFRSNEHGFFQAHAYPFDGRMSTFIVECAESVWRGAGLDRATETESIAYCEQLFARDLRDHKLQSNNSKWINFVTLRNKTWRHGNVVLLGDAAHTAHFSIGSGTKLAMEDAIALANALETKDTIASALAEYEMERKPRVERFQEAARQSQTYFENTSRYQHMEPLQFAFHLLSRSGRIDYDDLRVRDRHFVGAVDRWFSARARGEDAGVAIAESPAFARLSLRGLEVANRVAVAVAPSYRALAGMPSDGGLAAGARTGAGLVFSDIVAVSESGRITRGCSGIYSDAHAEAWKAEVDRARARSTAALALTLNHSGPRGATRSRALGADIPLHAEDAWPTLAASSLPHARHGPLPEAIDPARMDAVLEDFAACARRAYDAGFDMIEIHMGHGYLLASFLSPLSNIRTDEFGGELENRLRFPLAVLDAVRTEWPDSRPVGVALSAADWAPRGLGPDDAVEIARALSEHGCDVVRVLAGQTIARFRPHYDPYFLTHYADRIRNEAGIATIATGDITTVDHVNTIVAGGRAELCLLRTAAT